MRVERWGVTRTSVRSSHVEWITEINGPVLRRAELLIGFRGGWMVCNYARCDVVCDREDRIFCLTESNHEVDAKRIDRFEMVISKTISINSITLSCNIKLCTVLFLLAQLPKRSKRSCYTW